MSDLNTIDTGIFLEITSWVGSAGEMAMDIRPSFRDADIKRI